MRVRIQLFAVARQLVGSDEVFIEVAGGAVIRDVGSNLAAEIPALKNILAHSRWAVDAVFVGDDHPVDEQSEIALIPPVSGG
jgi:molybdopterin converting factor small subunit